MFSTHPDRSILHVQIYLSGCVVCVVHIQIDLSYTYRYIYLDKIDPSGCVVCVAHIQIDLSYTYGYIYLDV